MNRVKIKPINRTIETASKALDLVDEALQVGITSLQMVNTGLDNMKAEMLAESATDLEALKLQGKIEVARLKVELDSINKNTP